MNIVKKFRILCFPLLCILLLSCKSSEDANGSNELLSDFFGTFIGAAESVVGGEMSERELTIVIEPWKSNGFTVNWTTQIFRSNGKNKLTDLSINFYPSSRPGIYAAASRSDVFGRAVPFDPVAQDAAPYIWAGLQGNTLTVSALYILDGGGHELHVYKRSVIDEGLLLQFDRVNNGQQAVQVSALLNRIE